MTQRDNILQELQELKSILADAGFHPTFQAPSGYFERLADEILKRVRALESINATEELANLSPLLNTISKEMPNKIPAGYFDILEKKLEQSISTRTAQEELEDLSPLLSELKKKKTYSVPEGYFENLQQAIEKDHIGFPTKVISLTHRKWFRYAAAAVVTGVVATAGFFFLNNKESINPSDKSYAWVKKNLKKVSSADINEFVELANAGSADVVKADTKEEIRNLLKDVSDKEIQEFLNDTQSAEAGTDDDLIWN